MQEGSFRSTRSNSFLLLPQRLIGVISLGGDFGNLLMRCQQNSQCLSLNNPQKSLVPLQPPTLGLVCGMGERKPTSLLPHYTFESLIPAAYFIPKEYRLSSWFLLLSKFLFMSKSIPEFLSIH